MHLNMTFFWGMLALAQTLVLPGQLLLQPYKKHLPVLTRLVVGIPLSLTVSYLIGVILLAVGCFLPWVLRSIVAVELVILMILANRLPALQQPFWQRYQQAYHKMATSALGKVLFYGALLVLLWAASIIATRYGQVFWVNDSLISWNGWARALAESHIPQTYSYPWLLPINQAVTYVMIGLPPALHIDLFAVLLMSIFPLLCLLALWDRFLAQPQKVHLLGILIIAWLMYSIFGGFLGQGYAHIPTATIAFVTMMALLIGIDAKLPAHFFVMVIGLLMAGVAVAKQAGIWFGPVIILLTAVWYRRSAMVIVGQILMWLLLGISWYGFNHFYHPGRTQQLLQFLTHAIYHGEGWWQRVVGVFKEPHKWFWICMILALYAMKTDRFARWVVPGVVLLGTLIWALGFSYGYRNVAIVIPFLGYCSAIGLAAIAQWPKMKALRVNITAWTLKRMPAFWIVLVVLVVFALSQQTRWSVAQYRSNQAESFRQLLGPSANMLYGYASRHGLDGTVATLDGRLIFLPQTQGNVRYIRPEKLISAVDTGQVQYIISDSEYKPYIQHLLHQDKLVPVSYTYHSVLYQVQ
jgi:hypothetical protein